MAILEEHGFPPFVVARPMDGGHYYVLRFVACFDKGDAAEVERVRACMGRARRLRARPRLRAVQGVRRRRPPHRGAGRSRLRHAHDAGAGRARPRPAAQPRPVAGPGVTAERALFTRLPRLVDLVPFVELADGLPTPVEQLDDRLWVQRDDLTSSEYGGNKVRKLEFVLPIAQRRGGPVLTAGGTGSHHVVAAAVHGRRLGLDVEAVQYPQPDTDDVEHTRTTLAAPRRHRDDRRALALRDAGRARGAVSPSLASKRPYLLWPGASTPLGTLGHVSAGLELAAAMDDEPDDVVVALGSGGTAVGLALGLRLGGMAPRHRRRRARGRRRREQPDRPRGPRGRRDGPAGDRWRRGRDRHGSPSTRGGSEPATATRRTRAVPPPSGRRPWASPSNPPTRPRRSRQRSTASSGGGGWSSYRPSQDCNRLRPDAGRG